jgi:glycosyltransferase involved in cell wall biosynthesis
MATFNSMPIIKKSLQSIRSQDYPQDKIEIIIADGGSTDGTLTVLKEYNCTIINENTGNPDMAKAISLSKSKNDLILHLDDDNILPKQNWLLTMVKYFEQEPKAVGCYTWRYHHQFNDTPLNRYFALIGANDPLAYFLGRTDRQHYLPPLKKYRLTGNAINKGDYFLVEFNKNNVPTLGANGFLIKRKLLEKVTNPKCFYHIDDNLRLIKKGYNRYVVVKNDIFHSSGERFWHYFKKRARYLSIVHLEKLPEREYFTFNLQTDKLKLIIFAVYSNTLIFPALKSIRGFLAISDPAWFLHPLICFGIFWVYTITVIKNFILNLQGSNLNNLEGSIGSNLDEN